MREAIRDIDGSDFGELSNVNTLNEVKVTIFISSPKCLDRKVDHSEPSRIFLESGASHAELYD